MARKSRKHLPSAPIEQKEQKQYIAGIYARTSSENQEGDSVENQIKIAEGYILSNQNIKLHKFYADYGFSSFAHIRPSFEDMLSDIKAGIINCVIVKDISRFSRDYLETGDYIERIFPLWDTRLISVNDNFHGKLYCGMCGRKMRHKRSVNGSIYYICPRQDEASFSCTSKARSEKKLREQVFIILNKRMESHKAAVDENHPYFRRRAIEQDKLLHKYKNELDYQEKLLCELYEEIVSSNTSNSTDLGELMHYLHRVRYALQGKICNTPCMFHMVFALNPLSFCI